MGVKADRIESSGNMSCNWPHHEMQYAKLGYPGSNPGGPHNGWPHLCGEPDNRAVSCALAYLKQLPDQNPPTTFRPEGTRARPHQFLPRKQYESFNSTVLCLLEQGKLHLPQHMHILAHLCDMSSVAHGLQLCHHSKQLWLHRDIHNQSCRQPKHHLEGQAMAGLFPAIGIWDRSGESGPASKKTKKAIKWQVEWKHYKNKKKLNDGLSVTLSLSFSS